MSDYYFVARRPDDGFIGSWNIESIRSQHASGLFSDSLFVTNSLGQTYRQYQTSGRKAIWVPIVELWGQSPPQTITSQTTSGDNRLPSVSRRNLDRPHCQLLENFGGGGLSSLFLILGQIATAVACVGTPIVLINQLDAFAEVEKQFGKTAGYNSLQTGDMATKLASAKVIAVLAAIIIFCLNMALFVVFKRAISLKIIAKDQDFENRRIWQAISDLRPEASIPPGGASKNNASANPSG